MSASARSISIMTAALAASALAPGRARAEDLAEAISLAYETNPALVSQRAQLQATDEGYVQAEAGFRPTVSLQAGASYSRSPQSSLFGGQVLTEANTGSAALSVTQPLYTGGRTTAEVRAAEAQIRAGREQLRSVEANVTFAVIQAYCDVLRDRAALAIQKEGFKILLDAVNEIRARFEAGAITVTDKFQAETQLESTRAQLESAQAQLEISTAEYVTAVGRSPGDLTPPPTLPALPADVGTAFDIADRESPTIRQAQFTEAADRAQVQEAQASGRPTVSLSGQFGYIGSVVPLSQHDYLRNVGVTATISQPLFSGGLIASQVRQAAAQDTSARVQVEVARRNMIQAVSQAWSQRRAAHANTVSDAAAVMAAQATFDGMRVEYRAGLRTTLEVLIAQETLTGAEIALAAARHDEYVAEASLLGAVGRLEPRIVLQGQPLYRPEVSFRRVENRGSVPWQAIPETLDRLGAPSQPQPGSLPEPRTPSGPVRVAPAMPATAPPTAAQADKPMEAIR